MFKIDRDTLYSKEDIQSALAGSGGGVDVQTFLATLKPRKVFKRLYWGEDLLAALARARELREDVGEGEQAAEVTAVRRGGGRPKKSQAAASRLIGGVFRPEEIGLRASGGKRR